MNSENLNQILTALDQLSPRKAKKLREMIQQQSSECDSETKGDHYQKIWNYLYYLFLSCLTRESKNTLVNTNVSINELCYLIGKKAHHGWCVYGTGAFRLAETEEGIRIVGDIPREHGKGFMLKEKNPKTLQEIQDAEEELDFYTRFQNQLDVLSGEMDFKETFLTYGYQVRDSRIPKEFVELLITTLELSRVDPEDVKNDYSTK